MNIMAVAKRARVSTATVSRVINGTAFVAPATAERVRNAIDTLNFYPDTNARTLGSGRSGMYGLIISDITNPYFPELVKAFEDIAVEHKQEVLIANTNYDPKRMETCVVRMLQRKVDGIAIMTSEMEDRLLRTFSHRQIPLVFMDSAVSGPSINVIQIDYEAGVKAAMDHLFELGHENIAFISGPLSLRSAQVRAKAFRQALEQHGVVGPALWMQKADHRVEGGARAMQRILASSKRLPSAVMASNDLTAIGAMGAIQAAGLRIPQDISIIGFDGIELAAYTQPALTTLLIPRRELAALAFHCLFQYKEKPSKSLRNENRLIEPKLIMRASTARASTTSTSKSSRRR